MMVYMCGVYVYHLSKIMPFTKFSSIQELTFYLSVKIIDNNLQLCHIHVSQNLSADPSFAIWEWHTNLLKGGEMIHHAAQVQDALSEESNQQKIYCKSILMIEKC